MNFGGTNQHFPRGQRSLDGTLGDSPQIKAVVTNATLTALDAEARKRYTTRSELIRSILEERYA